MYEYPIKKCRVVDGDTFQFEVKLGFGVTIDIMVRLSNYDAPEVTGKEKEQGLIVKDICNELFALYKDVRIKTFKTSKFNEKDKSGKHGRYLAEVYLDGVNLVDLLYLEFSHME